VYSKSFYLDNQNSTKKSAEIIIDFILKLYKPCSVVDIGCSSGVFLNGFMQKGINDVVGVDGPWIEDEMLLIPKENFIRHDLSKPLNLNRKFDLAICLEVLEHLSLEVSMLVLEELSGLSDIILFSAAIPMQGGTHHINERWPAFWAKNFKKFGYRFVDVRPFLWNNEDLLPEYKQNMLLYIKSDLYETIVEKFEAYKIEEPFPLVHPEVTFAYWYYVLGGADNPAALLVHPEATSAYRDVPKPDFFTRIVLKIMTITTRLIRAYVIKRKL
jgi:hypothetical protein